MAATVRRSRQDGARSQAAILAAAVDLASVHGLEGLTIGALAARTGMSKSGLFAHFGTKEALQLRTIAAARAVFDREILRRGPDAPPGIARLVTLSEAYLSSVERRVFPGGCFFAAAAAELDSRPGAARSAVLRLVRRCLALLARAVRDAQRLGELGPRTDAVQVAFEVGALLAGANAWFLMTGEADALARARRGIESVLLREAASR